MPKRPDWFEGFWEEAIQMSGRTHELAESALGIAKLIDRGETVEAERLYRQARAQLILLRLDPSVPGEIGSTQLRRMVRSREYPVDLRNELSRRMPAIHDRGTGGRNRRKRDRSRTE
jgi:hypothetical protein